ncbi:hypothetical protein [Bacillus thuringiensis]|uniref:hypothetical protein n=1 Tax=Bacillus thuringiensis TaxID=1428 RepID=UPI000BFE1BD6|nr:hypothetical protein [Bacillus thuringiensis]PGK46854.1 hypothetical protein CN908_00145 [Bacillus thuringiensis]
MHNNNELSDVLTQFNPKILEEQIITSIANIQSVISKVDPLSILIHMYGYNLSQHLMNPEDALYGNVNPSISKGMDLVQSMIVSSKPTIDAASLNVDELKCFLDTLEKLYLNASMYVNVVPKDELIKYSQGMQMNVSGTLYPYFEEEHFRDLLLPYNKLFIDYFNVSAEDIMKGLMALSERLRTTEFIYYFIDKGAHELTADKILQVADYFDVEKITKWPVEFIKNLALQPGDKTGFLIDISNVMFKEMPIKYKPFICIEGKYYCFSINNLMDNFYRSVMRALRGQDEKLVNVIGEIQQSVSEAVPFKLFNKILPTAQIFRNVYYKAPVGANGKNEWCECDGLILFDDVMIIVEVKGGALSPVSPFSDEEAYKKSLRALAQNPYEQSLRLFEEYNRTNEIEIYSKETKKRYKLLETINNVKFIQACCVTLDDFNEIAAQIEKTEFIKESALPVWCVSINDLRVYPEIFDSPSIFMNYLYQRSLASKNPVIKTNDELDHIGLYFEYNNYSMSISEMLKEVKANDVFIPSHRDDIDMYMAGKVNDKFSEDESENFFEVQFGPIEKPKQNMDPIFEKLIRLLDSTRDNLCIRAARYLLLLDTGTRENVREFISSRTQKLLLHKQQFWTPYVAYNYKKEDREEKLPIIMMFLLNASNKLFKDPVERKRFLMERVMHEDEPILCVVLGVNKNKELTKVITQIITPEQFQALPESAYETLKHNRQKIGRARRFKEFSNER